MDIKRLTCGRCSVNDNCDNISFMPQEVGGLGVGGQNWVNGYCLSLKWIKGRKTLNNRNLRDILFKLIISISIGKAVDKLYGWAVLILLVVKRKPQRSPKFAMINRMLTSPFPPSSDFFLSLSDS